jgi:hypothetical protein
MSSVPVNTVNIAKSYTEWKMWKQNTDKVFKETELVELFVPPMCKLLEQTSKTVKD